MASSQCTSCGLIHQPGQCRRQISTTSPGEGKPVDITPAYCCRIYLCCTGFLFFIFLFPIALASIKDSCYLEFFADSVSVSNANVNANVSTADWRIGFVATSPVTGCKISLNRVQSRLLRGDQVMSNSSSPSSDYFQQFVAGDKRNVRFEKVVMPEVIDDVIWDFRVEIMSAVNTDVRHVNGFLMATCPDIPVKFTTDPAGNVVGSLFGNMRRCDFIFQHKLDSSS